MENQHRKINGYRELSQEEIDLMNEIKSFGPLLEQLCDKVRKHIDTQYEKAYGSEPSEADVEEVSRLVTADPLHWENWGRSTAQTVLMYLTRAVAQPTFF